MGKSGSFRYIDVAIPLPIPNLYTYEVPDEYYEAVAPGMRVTVPFGKSKIYTGIIFNIHQTKPEKYTPKPILDLPDAAPVMTPSLLKFLSWMADYYMCTIGEAVNAALPSGLKLSSESNIQRHPDFELWESQHEFSEQEAAVLERLEETDSLTYPEVARMLEIKSPHQLIHRLAGKGAVLIYEQLQEKYQPKKVKMIRLAPDFARDHLSLEQVFGQLSRAPKQEDILLFYLKEIPVFDQPEANEKGMEKSVFSKSGLSTSALNQLIKKEILEEFEVQVSRFPESKDPVKTIQLSPVQNAAKEDILKVFRTDSTALLYGITGSGKTEIYIDLIQKNLSEGKQSLYLLPEIALTTQIVTRLKAVFGNKIGVYHSRFSDNERVEVWNGVLSGRYQAVVGVRSAIFLPFDRLGLVIVDEEHENSYKQYQQAPRYQARDAAIMMGVIYGAKVLLGTATPSVESYFNALEGKYGLVNINERFGTAVLPTVEIANISTETKKRTMKGPFTGLLKEKIDHALNEKEQVILFQNRRGHSHFITCQDCGWTAYCQNCSVSLTYHQYQKRLICHYCGYNEPMPLQCEACGSTRLQTVGYGTEQIEEYTQTLFEDTATARMDLDTTRSKTGYEKIIQSFEAGEAEILIGTQMVTKGLDFGRVGLVGIMDIDRMMHFPDFRSRERAFQLAVQVSGRSGRREKPGLVILQTRNPEDALINQIRNHNYEDFYHQEIVQRQKHLYPPFSRLIRISIKHRDAGTAEAAGKYLAKKINQSWPKLPVLGPEPPLVNRIRNLYYQEILIKLVKGIPIQTIKAGLNVLAMETNARPEFKSARIVFDVDPH